MAELPPEIQSMVAQLQQLQQQLQSVVNQKMHVEAMGKEAEESLKAVQGTAEDTPLYKVAGNVLVRVEKGKIMEELEEKKTTYDLRVKTLKKQEDKLKEKLTELQNKIQGVLSPQAG